MNFKKPAVTMLDKQKAKKTLKVFGILTAVFSSIIVALAVILPKAKTLKGIDNNIDKIFENAVSIKNGDEYVIFSNEIMQRYDVETNKFIDEYPYASKISEMVSNQYNVDLTNAFVNQTIHYQNTSDTEGYFVCFDVYGDLFKIDFKNNEFVLSNDCYLNDRCTIILNGREKKLISQHLIRNVVINGSNCYTLSISEGLFWIRSFDLNNLRNGTVKSRNIYRYVTPNRSQRNDIESSFNNKIYEVHSASFDSKLKYSNTPYFIADPLVNTNGTGENPYSLFVQNDSIYVATTLGIYSFPLDFNDFNETNIVNYATNSYIEKQRVMLLNETDQVLSNFGVTNKASLSTASNFYISSLFKNVFAKKYASLMSDFSVAIVVENKNWLTYYDPTVYSCSFIVFEEGAKTTTSRFMNKGPNFNMGGMSYSPIQKTLYLINIIDNTLYYFDPLKINSLEFNSSLNFNSFANKTEVVFEGKSFFENHGALSYDPVADSLHVTFENDRDLCVIDIVNNDIKTRYLFSCHYDIAGFFENDDRDKLIVIYNKERTTLQNVSTFPMQIDIIEPNTYQFKNVFVILLIAFAILDLASIIIILITAKNLKSDKAMLKSKVIARDLKRHKWTYIALIPFIALLILFCYVEAIGSISFSFFSYTQQKPTYIWNDFGNYIKIFHDSGFWTMFFNTFFFMAFDLFFGLIPPVIFAFFLSIIKNKKLSGTLRALMFIPAIVPGIASLLIWKIGIFGDDGVLNSIICLFKFGTTTQPAGYQPIQFLGNTNISRWSLLLMGFPYVGGYLIFYGGLMNIPGEYHEACKLEGLGVIETFFKVDLPLIKPQMKYILVMTILSSAQNYERTYMLESTGTTTLVETMYREMKLYSNYGMASAYATIIFLLLLIPVLINFKDTRKNNLGDQI